MSAAAQPPVYAGPCLRAFVETHRSTPSRAERDAMQLSQGHLPGCGCLPLNPPKVRGQGTPGRPVAFRKETATLSTGGATYKDGVRGIPAHDQQDAMAHLVDLRAGLRDEAAACTLCNRTGYRLETIKRKGGQVAWTGLVPCQHPLWAAAPPSLADLYLTVCRTWAPSSAPPGSALT